MKKFLIFALVAIMLAVNVFAADATYDVNDLKSMFRDIFKMYVEYPIRSVIQLSRFIRLFVPR